MLSVSYLRYIKPRIAISLAAGLLVAPLLTHAGNDYDTVYSSILNTTANGSGIACMSCHTGSDPLGCGAPTYFSMSVYGDAALYATSMHTRTDPLSVSNMPMATNCTYNDAAVISNANRTLLLNWANAGTPKGPASATTNAISGQQKTQVTLNGTVNTNTTNPNAVSGKDGEWYFEWGPGTTATYSNGAFSTTTRNSISSGAVSAALSGLSCGTTYHYRVVAKNGDSTANGSKVNFSTAACTAPVITEGATINPTATNEDTQTTFTLNRTDDDPGTLTWSVQTQGSKGTFSFDTSTTASPVTVRYTPTSDLNGSDAAGVIRVTNATTGLSDSIAVTMSITAVNDQPSITSTAPASATEGVEYSYPVVVDDPDDSFGAGLTIALSNEPTGMTVDTNTGIITWTPGNGVTTSGTVTVLVNDGYEDGTTQTSQMFTVSVTATNDPPTITSTAPTSATEDVEYSYQVVVSDVDDANNGVDLTFSLSNQPSGMVVSSTGLITWTPANGVTTSGSVTVQVADGGENGASPDTEIFTITVTAVNDPPVITSTVPATTYTENDAFSYQVTASDVDDTGGLGVDLTISLSNEPAGMSVNTTGLISWAVPRTATFNNTYSNITVTVADGGEDGAAPDTEIFSLTVNPPDADLDGVPDYADNCPSVANGAAEDNQADMDGDTTYITPQTDPSGIPASGDVDPTAKDSINARGEEYLRGGDACDEDVDGDGISKVFEDSVAYLSDTNAADAALDQDGDGVSNLDEFLAGTDPAQDSVGPVVIAPADITVNATGYLTTVNIGVASATDGNDGSIASIKPIVNATASVCAELADYPQKPAAFRPGAHVVNWTTCDKAGNLASDTQNVLVKPIMNTTLGQAVGEGQSATVKVMLNGDAPAYPVNVHYQVTGSASTLDHDLVSGWLSISQTDVDGNNPGRIGKLNLNIANDAVIEGDEIIRISLSSASNAHLGTVNVHNITIVDAGTDTTPVVTASITQNGVATGRTIYADAGTVVVTANTTDTNSLTAPVFDWSQSDNALSGTVSSTATSSTFSFDPSVLSAGHYRIIANVSDNNLSGSASFLLTVVASAPALSAVDTDGDGLNDDDAGEGAGDSNANGIANYLDDNRIVDSNVLQNQTGDPANSYLLATEPGLMLKLGTAAQASGAVGALISKQAIIDYGSSAGGAGLNAEDSYSNLSGYYDFEISGLTQAMTTAKIVIPLPVALRANAEYRKYNGSGWSSFVVDSNNTISSAKGELGVCPAPGSGAYTSGLTAFDFCVQLQIEDGGPNDADGVRDFVIRDPGGAAVAPEATPAQSTPKGRLGVLHPLVLLMLTLAALYLYRRKQQ